MTDASALSADILEILREMVEEVKHVGIGVVAEDDDVFEKYGLDSVEGLRLVVKLENRFVIEIGSEPTDFLRIRTLAGLTAVVAERLEEVR